ncbi:MAG: adenylyltransferase/cytidyltransferase family protein [Candidatus Gracilibacteria bacterium]|jgi:FAD synthetase
MNNTTPLKKVIAFGTFDLFHAGHENYLKQAKALGEYLIVIIARDETVRKIKGRQPDDNERQRAKSVKKSGIADKVVLGYHNDKHKVLKKFRPDVIALGYDQFVFTQRLEKTLIDLKLNAMVERLQSYEPQVYKSSLLRKAILGKDPISLSTSLKTSEQIAG